MGSPIYPRLVLWLSVRDPRTQEILKGHVTLGSLRVRQDYLIAEGLIAPYGEDDSIDEAKEKLSEFALARIRQLSAHEVGHTLGIAHNFAASADGRASVMDYPHPLVTLDDSGEIVLEGAYDVGIGDWDKRAVIWGYQDFPDGTSAQRVARPLCVKPWRQAYATSPMSMHALVIDRRPDLFIQRAACGITVATLSRNSTD